MKTIYKKLFIFLLLLPFGALAQSIKGTVTEKASGQSLPGVNVVVQGTTNGTSTDFDGNYTLNNVKRGDKIVFSYIGFKEVVVNYNGQATLNQVLDEDANQLQEVVVQVGYGTVRRKDASTAVTTVSEKDFQKGPVVGAEQLIQGRASGVQVITASGEPGGGSFVRIRSGSSYINNDPLYVIDGVAVETGGGGITGGRNPLATINQNDIASMTILKDAAATAIYGSRASNGVIIITTKRGRTGDMKVTYNGNFQVSEVVKTVDILNANEFRSFVNTFGVGPDGENNFAGFLGNANTDWQKEIYRTAMGTDHNVALSGGTDNITYRTSLGYTNINGLLKHDNFERQTLGLNLVGDFFDKHLRIEVNSKSAVIHNDYSERGAIGAAVTFDPTQPVRSGNDAFGGYFQWQTNGAYEVNANRNPVSLLEQKHNFGNQFRSIGNAQAEYKIHSFEDLKLVANFGYDYNSGRSYGNTDADYVVPGEAGSTYERFEDKKNLLMDLYFNYNKTVESWDTNFDVTGGYSYQMFTNTTSGSSYSAANDVTTPNNPFYGRLNLQSFFGRATISIADKYILNGSFRMDGSSRFVEENRWGYFPAASAAWRIDNEDFLKESNIISELKLRASWGKTGQQDTGNFYPSYPLYNAGTPTAQYPMGYDGGGFPIYYQTYTPLAYNSDLVWETTETLNAGVDFGFFNGRITGAVEVYKRNTKDVIITAPNPQGVNFSNEARYNIGEIENEGVEISFDVFPVRTDDITWRIGANGTFQKSEITKITNGALGGFTGYNVGGVSGGTGTTVQNNQQGFAPFSFYVFEQAYDADGAPIDGVFVDRNEDGIVNSEDLYRFHKPASDFFYGFNTDVTYRNWWLSMSFRGSVGNYNYNNVASSNGNLAVLPGNGNYLLNPHSSVLGTQFDQPRYLSDYYVQDASFLRMDNVTLGYTFKDVFEKGSSMRLTGAVQNVFVISGYNGIDPELTNGIDNNFYPRPRTYTLGLNVNF